MMSPYLHDVGRRSDTSSMRNSAQQMITACHRQRVRRPNYRRYFNDRYIKKNINSGKSHCRMHSGHICCLWNSCAGNTAQALQQALHHGRV